MEKEREDERDESRVEQASNNNLLLAPISRNVKIPTDSPVKKINTRRRTSILGNVVRSPSPILTNSKSQRKSRAVFGKCRFDNEGKDSQPLIPGMKQEEEGMSNLSQSNLMSSDDEDFFGKELEVQEGEFFWEGKSPEMYFSELSRERNLITSMLKEGFNQNDNSFGFITSYLSKGKDNLFRYMKELYVIWETHIENMEKLYKGEKALYLRLKSYDLLKQFKDIDKTNQIENDPLSLLMLELVPCVCSHKEEQLEVLHANLKYIKDINIACNKAYNSFKTVNFKKAESLYKSFSKLSKEVQKKKQDNSIAFKEYQEIHQENQLFNKKFRQGKRDTLNALIKQSSLKLEIFYGVKEQEKILLEFLALFKESMEDVFGSVVFSLRELNELMKNYFGPNNPKFTTSHFNELIDEEEKIQVQNEMIKSDTSHCILNVYGDLVLLYSNAEMVRIQEQTAMAGINGFKKIINNFKFRYRKKFKDYIGSNWVVYDKSNMNNAYWITVSKDLFLNIHSMKRTWDDELEVEGNALISDRLLSINIKISEDTEKVTIKGYSPNALFFRSSITLSYNSLDTILEVQRVVKGAQSYMTDNNKYFAN